MSQIATAPNGQPLVAIYATEAEAEAAQARVFLNGQHIEADRQPELRDKVSRGELSITDVPRDAKNFTRRWADPRQTELGEWHIPVPADETRLRARLRRCTPRIGALTPARHGTPANGPRRGSGTAFRGMPNHARNPRRPRLGQPARTRTCGSRCESSAAW